MTQTVDQALKAAQLYSDDYEYRLIKLPPNAVTVAAGIVAQAGNPFTALLVDKDEVSLLLEDEDFHEFGKRLRDHEVSETRYRLITFDVELDPTLVGFMAHISTALAEADISILTFAAFSRDHLFVSNDNYEQAMKTLQNLKEAAG